MQYFNNLPIVNINDEQHRNLFKRVVVDYIKENQLINYRIKDFETLPSIANNLYGSAEYWWVIALLNNIYDINFDLPLPTQQIEYVANELATEYKFDNSLFQSGLVEISAGSTSREISFRNDNNKEYFISLLPSATMSQLRELGDYGIQKINNSTFKIVISNTLSDNFYFTYGVFIKPQTTVNLNMSKFAEYFDKLIREADAKRNIRLIKSQDLSYFVTQFLLSLNETGGSSSAYQYKKSINFLKDEDENTYATSGLIVDIKSNTLVGNDNFKEIIIDKYDYDYQVHLSVKPTDEQLGSVGSVGVRANYLRPRIYNSGDAQAEFDYMVVAPDNKQFSTSGEILESGIDTFAGGSSEKLIDISDYDNILSPLDVGVMITPIIDDYRTLSNIGIFGFECIDKNVVKVYNTGNSGNRFFWSIYETNFSPYFEKFSGAGESTNIVTGFITTDYSRVCILISPIFNTWNDLGNVGEIAYGILNTTSFDVFNSGNSTAQFSYKVYNTGQYNEIAGGGISGVDVVIQDELDIITPEDICICIVPIINDASENGNIGDIAVQLIDKNNIKIMNTGSSGKIKWFLISDKLFHGISNFAGANNYTTINIANHADITHSSQICLMITPLVDNIGDIGYIGDYAFKAISNNEIRVYNTGNAGNRFKWAVVRGDNA